MSINSLLITGYSGSDLGIFRDNDPKIEFIKLAIHDYLASYEEQGGEWLIFTGQLGFEYWALQEAKANFPDFKTATIFPFENHGEHWNEANRAKLQLFKETDFVKYSFPAYENPRQFRAYDQFLADNTDAAYIFYDEENESKLHFLVDFFKSQPDYPIDFLDFERLQDIVEEKNEA